MKLVLFVVCIVATLLIVLVLLVTLYHSNGRNEVQRKSAQFKKDVENRLQYAVHLGDDTFILDKQDKLLVYQKSAKNPEKFLPPQVIGLPSEGGDFISIIPFGGLPSEGCRARGSKAPLPAAMQHRHPGRQRPARRSPAMPLP